MRQITWEQEQSINELIADLRHQIVAYQIAKDNLELRLAYAKSAVDPDIMCEPQDDGYALRFAPSQVY
jgi:hypothetical protein